MINNNLIYQVVVKQFSKNNENDVYQTNLSPYTIITTHSLDTAKERFDNTLINIIQDNDDINVITDSNGLPIEVIQLNFNDNLRHIIYLNKIILD